MESHNIDGETWAQVYSLARNGERHPDPEVAAAAYEWALDVRADRGRLGMSALLKIATDVLLSSVGGGVSAGSDELSQWRQARRIARLGPPPQADV